MADPLSPEQRSALMAKVRSKGNRSTEMKAVSALERNGVKGWVQQPPDFIGHPDFVFPELRITLFVDGCFWHGCPECGRVPKSRVQFWKSKIENNMRRDESVTKELVSNRFRVMRVWEHELRSDAWLDRLVKEIDELEHGFARYRFA